MIRGDIIFGRPFVRAIVVIPRLSVRGGAAFLVGTVADVSLLSPRDASYLGINFDPDFQASPISTSRGLGGSSTEVIEPGELLLRHDDGNWDRIPLDLAIALPTDDNRLMPSLLGRDVLYHFKLIFQESTGLITLD